MSAEKDPMSAYQRMKKRRAQALNLRLQFERDTEWKTQVYIA